MNGNRSKGAWIWVAMVAISFASFARVQSGVENARAYADRSSSFLPRATRQIRMRRFVRMTQTRCRAPVLTASI